MSNIRDSLRRKYKRKALFGNNGAAKNKIKSSTANAAERKGNKGCGVNCFRAFCALSRLQKEQKQKQWSHKSR